MILDRAEGRKYMQYISHYNSELGDILLLADDEGLAGLWFEGQKYYARGLEPGYIEKDTPVIKAAKNWLVRYFAGEKPDINVKLHLKGTDFQLSVWEELCRIPYGRTSTYGQIAEKLASEKGISHMSARAVGSAVGHNPISIFVPCHRVIGSDGSLTGYAGGIDRKKRLLALEGAVY